MSEGARCHTGIIWWREPGTSCGPLVRSGRTPTGCRNAEAGSKASSGRMKQTAKGCFHKQLLGCHALGLPG